MGQPLEAYVGDSMDDMRMEGIHWRVPGFVAGGHFIDVLDEVALLVG